MDHCGPRAAPSALALMAGREPSTVMELGPQLEIVHETRSGWRIRPYGPTIYVPFRRTTPLAGAMERAGVRVVDWRGDWARRHRLLDRLGALIGLVGGVGMLMTIAQDRFGPSE